MKHGDGCYASIINSPRHVSADRPHMSNHDRAAQFAPFAALTGLDNAMEETARLTLSKPELDEEEKCLIDMLLRYVKQNINAYMNVSIICFVPDLIKDGGELIKINGVVRTIDDYTRTILFDDGRLINIDDVTAVEIIKQP